jgi:hypothetical protein
MIGWDWKKIKKDIISNDVKNSIALARYQDAVKEKYIDMNGLLTLKGYNLYLSVLTVLNKNNIFHGPVRTQRSSEFSIEYLLDNDIIEYRPVAMVYVISEYGEELLRLIAGQMNNKGLKWKG